MEKKNKRGIVIPTIIYWIIAIVVLSMIIIFSILMKDRLFELGDYIKNLFRR